MKYLLVKNDAGEEGIIPLGPDTRIFKKNDDIIFEAVVNGKGQHTVIKEIYKDSYYCWSKACLKNIYAQLDS